MPGTHSQYWEQIAESWSSNRPQRLWRAYSDLVNEALMLPRLEPGSCERLLKTDCFDEAVSATGGLYPALLKGATRVVGIDLSRGTLRSAVSHHPGFGVAGADVRQLPFADGAFDFVLSPSTLDHLDSIDDIAAGLAELRRILKPGGRLLLTLDNALNPVVALRNWLPQRVLTGLGVIPYEMGVTCGPRRLRALVHDAGFAQLEVGSHTHCPRAAAVAIANLLDRWSSERARQRFLRALLSWERLGDWPTRHLTGYYITVDGVAA
jgi:SAM-dependent methyltransferase